MHSEILELVHGRNGDVLPIALIYSLKLRNPVRGLLLLHIPSSLMVALPFWSQCKKILGTRQPAFSKSDSYKKSLLDEKILLFMKNIWYENYEQLISQWQEYEDKITHAHTHRGKRTESREK